MPRLAFAALVVLALLPVFLPAASAPARPRILGISHIALYTSDAAKARAFYCGFLGFAETRAVKRPSGGELIWIKINDRQWLELFPGAETEPSADRLDHVAFETDDVEAMARYLWHHGIRTTRPIESVIGNRHIVLRDPDGNTLEFMQYLPHGATRREAGLHLPEARISARLRHVGVKAARLSRAQEFYRDLLGFEETWRGSADGEVLSWVNLRVPDGDDYLELMLHAEPPKVPRLRIMHHLCLEVPDVEEAVRRLAERQAPEGLPAPTIVRLGVNRRRQVNYFDPDATRVEIMEDRTMDGAPVPSSGAPPPR